MAEIVLRADKVCKSYRDDQGKQSIHALRDVSFSLGRGEILGVIGRNGAGKSTLLKIMSEITPPTSGTISYEGLYTSILNIGTGFHPDLSGRENIYLKGALLGLSRGHIRAHLDEIVAFSGLEDYLDMQVKHYSDGMYLRLAFSVAFHAPIGLLYLDEVIAVGDADFRLKASRKIQELISRGTTIVLVSHNLNEITDICTRVLYLDKGEVRAIGPTLDVVEKYTEDVLSGANRQLEVAHPDHYEVEKILVHSVGKSPEEPIYVSDSIEIEFFILKHTGDFSLELSVLLMDMTGFRVFHDSYALRVDYQKTMVEPGRYCIRAKIPANLLNRGFYRINLTFSKDADIPLEMLVEAAVFHVRLDPVEHEHPKISRINTTLRIRLDWEIDRL